MGNDQDQFPDADILLTDNIHTLTQSPFGKSHDGQKIVEILNRFKKDRKILFVNMEDGSRGEEVGTEIHINADFYPNRCRMIPELAHEGAHKYWAAQFPKRNKFDDAVLDELRSQLIQLEVYAWAKKALGCKAAPDPELEERLKCLDSAPTGPYRIPDIGGSPQYLNLKTRITNTLKNSESL
jgi:hypothetical protein